MPTPGSSYKAKWMKKNKLVQPGIYIPADLWEAFSVAVNYANFLRYSSINRAKALNRTGCMIELMREFIINTLEKDKLPPGLSWEEIVEMSERYKLEYDKQ